MFVAYAGSFLESCQRGPWLVLYVLVGLQQARIIGPLRHEKKLCVLKGWPYIHNIKENALIDPLKCLLTFKALIRGPPAEGIGPAEGIWSQTSLLSQSRRAAVSSVILHLHFEQ